MRKNELFNIICSLENNELITLSNEIEKEYKKCVASKCLLENWGFTFKYGLYTYLVSLKDVRNLVIIEYQIRGL